MLHPDHFPGCLSAETPSIWRNGTKLRTEINRECACFVCALCLIHQKALLCITFPCSGVKKQKKFIIVFNTQGSFDKFRKNRIFRMETSIETSRNLALSFHSKLSAKFPLGSFLCIITRAFEHTTLRSHHEHINVHSIFSRRENYQRTIRELSTNKHN